MAHKSESLNKKSRLELLMSKLEEHLRHSLDESIKKGGIISLVDAIDEINRIRALIHLLEDIGKTLESKRNEIEKIFLGSSKELESAIKNLLGKEKGDSFKEVKEELLKLLFIEDKPITSVADVIKKLEVVNIPRRYNCLFLKKIIVAKDVKKRSKLGENYLHLLKHFKRSMEGKIDLKSIPKNVVQYILELDKDKIILKPRRIEEINKEFEDLKNTVVVVVVNRDKVNERLKNLEKIKKIVDKSKKVRNHIEFVCSIMRNLYEIRNEINKVGTKDFIEKHLLKHDRKKKGFSTEDILKKISKIDTKVREYVLNEFLLWIIESVESAKNFDKDKRREFKKVLVSILEEFARLKFFEEWDLLKDLSKKGKELKQKKAYIESKRIKDIREMFKSRLESIRKSVEEDLKSVVNKNDCEVYLYLVVSQRILPRLKEIFDDNFIKSLEKKIGERIKDSVAFVYTISKDKKLDPIKHMEEMKRFSEEFKKEVEEYQKMDISPIPITLIETMRNLVDGLIGNAYVNMLKCSERDVFSYLRNSFELANFVELVELLVREIISFYSSLKDKKYVIIKKDQKKIPTILEWMKQISVRKFELKKDRHEISFLVMYGDVDVKTVYLGKKEIGKRLRLSLILTCLNQVACSEETELAKFELSKIRKEILEKYKDDLTLSKNPSVEEIIRELLRSELMSFVKESTLFFNREVLAQYLGSLEDKEKKRLERVMKDEVEFWRKYGGIMEVLGELRILFANKNLKVEEKTLKELFKK